jgi:hypothetical protein
MSLTFSTNSGSVWSLNVSLRHGCNPKAFQIRPTLAGETPTRLANEQVDQCVASLGISSSVLTISSSTFSSLIARGTPGRGLSTSPSSRRSTKRLRHFPTVALETRSSRATSRLDAPAAHANTIRQRNANRCALLGRRAHRSKVERSSSPSTSSAFAGPLCTTVIRASHRR